LVFRLYLTSNSGSKVETILQANGDTIERTTVREKDVEHFIKLTENAGVKLMQEISALKQQSL
jgi:hypothetical protein